MKRVTVKPKSSKAKNRLINMMDNNPICIVEQDKGDGMMFLASENRKYFFWVNVSNDCNWECDNETSNA
jgi:hypothetical protein